jgi:L-rhamnose mutarotase
MDFIQELPATRVGNYSLYKVNDSGIFNNIYIIDNSRSIKETREQVEKWWDLVG